MNKKFVFSSVITAALVASFFFGYCHYYGFNAEEIIQNSELKNRTFSADVKEVVSSRHKIKAYLLEDNSNPIISLSFIFTDAGTRAEPEKQYGIAQMAAALMVEGAGKWNAEQFKEMADEYAVSISYGADGDDFSGQLLTTKENSTIAFEMLKQTLLHPSFGQKELKKIKRQAKAALKRQRENPQSQLSLLANGDLFGQHPYGRNPLGNEEDIENATASDIKPFIRNNLGQKNLIVGIAGDITIKESQNMLDEIFGNLPTNGAEDSSEQAKLNLSDKEKHYREDTAQNVAVIVAKGVNRNDKDFYPLYIANHVLGGSGLSSRLNQIARERQGLTYGIYTSLSTSDKAELIIGGFSSTAENFSTVVDILHKEWEKMGKEGVSAQELAEAKNYLLSSHNLRFADIINISNILAYMQKENLGIDFLQKRNQYVSKVTQEQVNSAAKRWFTKDNLKIYGLGKF